MNSCQIRDEENRTKKLGQRRAVNWFKNTSYMKFFGNSLKIWKCKWQILKTDHNQVNNSITNSKNYEKLGKMV